MNLMASVGVSLVVPSVTRLSSGSDEPWSPLGQRFGQHTKSRSWTQWLGQ